MDIIESEKMRLLLKELLFNWDCFLSVLHVASFSWQSIRPFIAVNPSSLVLDSINSQYLSKLKLVPPSSSHLPKKRMQAECTQAVTVIERQLTAITYCKLHSIVFILSPPLSFHHDLWYISQRKHKAYQVLYLTFFLMYIYIYLYTITQISVYINGFRL